MLEYEFEILEKSSSLEKAQVENLSADFVSKGILNGILSPEQALEILKGKELIKGDVQFDENNSIDTGETGYY